MRAFVGKRAMLPRPRRGPDAPISHRDYLNYFLLYSLRSRCIYDASNLLYHKSEKQSVTVLVL